MKDFTTRVETTDHELHIHLPEGFGPGAYEVVVTPVVLANQDITDEANRNWAKLKAIVEKYDLRAPDGWKFDRDEANERR